MDAELLRRAAKTLREHVDAVVIAGPWEYRDDRDDPETFPWRVWAPKSRVGAGTGFAPGTAQYMALVHPPVALAVAAWLDAQADVVGAEPERSLLNELDDDFTVENALTVARAILREGTDG